MTDSDYGTYFTILQFNREFVRVDIGDTEESKRRAVEENYGKMALVREEVPRGALTMGLLKKVEEHSDVFCLWHPRIEDHEFTLLHFEFVLLEGLYIIPNE